MKVAIHQPNFLPWRGFFEKARAADVFVLLDDVQFSKGSYTNRTRTQGGWLTVPVHAHGRPLIKDVLVAEDFTEPHFGHVALEGTHLTHFNVKLIWACAQALGVTRTNFVLASTLRQRVDPRAAGLLQLCRALEARQYLCGPSGTQYGVPQAFAGSGIEVVAFEWKPDTPIEELSVIESLKEARCA